MCSTICMPLYQQYSHNIDTEPKVKAFIHLNLLCDIVRSKCAAVILDVLLSVISFFFNFS